MTFTMADTTADTMTVTIVTLAGGYDGDYDGGYDRIRQAILAITIVTAPIVTARKIGGYDDRNRQKSLKYGLPMQELYS